MGPFVEMSLYEYGCYMRVWNELMQKKREELYYFES